MEFQWKELMLYVHLKNNSNREYSGDAIWTSNIQKFKHFYKIIIAMTSDKLRNNQNFKS